MNFSFIKKKFNCETTHIEIFLVVLSKHLQFHKKNLDQYCPRGWSVKRNKSDYSTVTCDPTDRAHSKCPKPYSCVASRCGINFCCVNDSMLNIFDYNKYNKYQK